MATITEKPLAQLRINSTNAVSVFSPSVITIIRTVHLCNTTALPVTFGLFLDNDGTTYDESTAKAFNSPLGPNAFLDIDTYWVMDNSAGNFAYQTSVANAITITVHGAEIT